MKTKKGILIDHDDSFTYNVKDWLSTQFDIEVINHRVFLNKNNFKKLKSFDFIVLSPGPLNPNNYDHILQLISQTDLPIIGICLGMQMLNIIENGSVRPYSPPHHGKESLLSSQLKIFNQNKVGRYHSLFCDVSKDKFDILATINELPMIICHKTKPWLAFQFHPESFLTDNSQIYLDFINQKLNTNH